MRSLIKDNSGYDLKHLFIGSEGTLGIITKLVFKLHPHQPVTQSMMVVLSEMSQLTDFFSMAQHIGGEHLIAFELLPGLGVEKALARYPDLQRPLETCAEWYILVRFAGQSSVEESLVIEPGAICYAVGHVGDGNIHYSAFPSDSASSDIHQEVYDVIDELIWSMDGSIVAEHGVGSIFVDRMRKQKSDIEYAMMQTVKNSFDPQGIMNPGKLLQHH